MNNRINEIIKRHHENTTVYELNDIDKLSKQSNDIFSMHIPFNKLSEVSTECIPVAHYYDDSGELQVVFSKEPTHCMAIGCTGAGKTTSLAIPKVQILSRLKNKPSFFIVDVKGELLENLSGSLKKLGYEVKVIDLNEPEYSLSWNPFSQIYDNFIMAHELVDKVIKHTDDINNYPLLKKFSFTETVKVWYEFDGSAFSKVNVLNKAIVHKREKLIADTSSEVKDLSYMFIKSNSNDDPHWDDSARDVFVGVVMGMLERTILQTQYALKKSQFNLKTIIDILLNTTEEEIKKFINQSNHDGDAYRYANRLVNMQAEKTRSCYYGVLSAQLSAFKSYAIQKVTISNSVNLSEISEKPTAIFMKMDDLKEANYSIAQLIVLRLFTELSKKASFLPRQRLARPVHFILDEFGNFPPFKNFANMISESRGRNIWYTMIVQSYRQLDIKYTEPIARIIIENSNMQMFFGSNDYKTKKEFSDSCGETTYISERAFLDGNEDYITNFPIEKYNVVTVSDLSRLKESEVYIISMGSVLHSRMERYFLVKEMNPLPPIEYRVLDNIELKSKKYSYDVSKEINPQMHKKNITWLYEEECEIKSKKIDISFEEMQNTTMYLINKKINNSTYGIKLLERRAGTALPDYYYEAIKSVSKSVLSFIDYTIINAKTVDINNYSNVFTKDIIAKNVQLKYDLVENDYDEFKTYFEKTLGDTIYNMEFYLPFEIKSAIEDAIAIVNNSDIEDIKKFLV